MDRVSIKEFLKELMDNPNLEIKDQGEWVSIRCPYAKFLHPNGTDINMSFGVKVNPHDKSVYNCFTCKKKGTLRSLVGKLQSFTGEDYAEILNGVEDKEYLGGSLPEYGNRVIYDTKYVEIGEPVSEDYLDVYDEAYSHPYVVSRGIDKATASLLDLRVDDNDHGSERILFPVRDPCGNFYGYTGRAVDEKVQPRVRDYFGLPKRHLLLGAHLKSTQNGYVVLVEGLFDYAKLAVFGQYNRHASLPLAAMHSGLTPYQADILKAIGLPVYTMYDDDKAGIEGTLHVKKVLGRHLPLYKTRYPKGVDDPNGLSFEEFSNMIADSRLL